MNQYLVLNYAIGVLYVHLFKTLAIAAQHYEKTADSAIYSVYAGPYGACHNLIENKTGFNVYFTIENREVNATAVYVNDTKVEFEYAT